MLIQILYQMWVASPSWGLQQCRRKFHRQSIIVRDMSRMQAEHRKEPRLPSYDLRMHLPVLLLLLGEVEWRPSMHEQELAS